MKRYRVNRTGGPKGSVSWESADILADFTFPWEDREPSPTEFRALWNEDRLSFRFDCEDDDLVLAPGADPTEKVMGSDRVEIFLAPDLGLNPYYGLEMDPRGEVLDYQGRFHRQFDWEWQCPGLDVKGEITDSGYTVAGSIPLVTLRGLGILKPGSRELFAGVYRAEFNRSEDSIHQGWMAWVDPATERPDFHVPSSFGVFELAG